MPFNKMFASFIVVCGAALLAACASQPAATTAPPASAPAATAAAAAPVAPADAAKAEADTASRLEKKFQDAAKGYKVVQKDGKNMYCKREKVIGSTIPTLQCISESQLRLQVEQMDDLRERMRTSSKCTLSRGCSGG